MTRIVYQTKRSLFSSETLTLFRDKTSELTRKTGRHIVRSLIRMIELTSVQYILRVNVRAGGVSAGGCMFVVASLIRGLLGARAREFRGVKHFTPVLQ